MMRSLLLSITIISAVLFGTTASHAQCSAPVISNFVLTSTTNVSCFNGSNGEIVATLTGGVSPFTYSLVVETGGGDVPIASITNTTSQVATFSGIPANAPFGGTYKVNVVTSNTTGGVPPLSFCQNRIISGINITQPTQLTLTTSTITPSCSGNDGSIVVTAGGGTPGYTFLWSVLPNPPGNTATGLAPGSYDVQVTDANNCIVSITGIVVPPGATANASVDQTICVGGTATMNGSVSGSATGGVWTTAGDGSFLSPTTLNTTYTPGAADILAGSVVLTLTTTGGVCPSDNDVMTLVINPLATVEAGNPQAICGGNFATLVGSSVGGSASTAAWSIFSSPGGGDGVLSSIAQTATPSTVTFTATVAGNYTLRLTTNDPSGPCLAVTDDVVITVDLAPIATAGADVTICGGTIRPFTGTSVSGSATTGAWSIFSSPVGGDGILSSIAQTATPSTVTFTATVAGVYVLRLTTNTPGGSCPADTDDVQITVNTAPTVFAGVDKIACGGTTVALSDATRGGGSATARWNIQTQPGGGDGILSNTTFLANPATVTFTATVPGNYTLRLLTNDPSGPCPAASDLVIVTIEQAPTVEAGSPQSVCASTVVSLTGSSIGGSATNGTWSIQTSPGGGDGILSSILPQVTPSSVTFTATVPGNYTLRLTTNDPANSCPAVFDDIVITILPAVVPTVSISANPGNIICSGTSVTFTATPTNGGASPTFQWKKNGGNVGSNLPTYTDALLANGDVITVDVLSNASCPVPATVTSNTITMTVNPTLTPSVSITANPSNIICAGTNVTFTAVPVNGGVTPVFQWKKNGSNVGTNSTTYADALLANGDVITVEMTSNETCPVPATVTSNSISMTVTPTVPASVSISANPGTVICPTTSVTFTATPVNGGASPTYQWKKNGGNVGTNSPTYTDATLANGDLITVDMVSNAICPTPTTATSNTLTMTVASPLVASVTISAAPGISVCTATSVTFTAVPANGGATPIFQWKKNGSNVGTNTNSYVDAGLVTGDVITVEMSSSLSCALPSPVASNSLVMTVSPPATANAGSDNSICAGSNFSLAGVIGGSASSGSWSGGTGTFNPNNNTLNATYTPSAAEVLAGTVTLILTTDDPAGSCTAATDDITITIVTAPALALNASPVVCAGSTSANLGYSSVSGGANEFSITYDAAALAAGFTNVPFSSLPVSPIVLSVPGAAPSTTYNATIIVRNTLAGCTGTVQAFTVTVSPTLVLATSGTVSLLCNGDANGAGTFTASGGTPGYTFAVISNNTGATTSTTATTLGFTGAGVGTIQVQVTDANGCQTNATINVIEPTALLLVNSGNIALTCNGSTNGTGTFTASGGTTGYTFAVLSNNTGATTSTTATTLDFTGAGVGTIQVQVSDANGCITTSSIVVTEPLPILLSVATTDNTRCESVFNGAANLTVTNGSGVFNFAWTGPNGFTATTEDIANVEDGTYTITVTEQVTNCVVSNNAVIINDGTVSPLLSPTIVANTNCTAPFNGAILLSVAPAGTYTYSWTGPGGFTSTLEDITALAAGSYQVTAKNIISGCEVVGNFLVPDGTSSITITTDAISDNSACNSPFNGAILISVSPAGSYTFSWTGPSGFTSAAEDLSALVNGDYNLTVTNPLGCSETTTITVGDVTPLIPLASQLVTDNSSCQAPFNGAITVTSGGTPGPYTFTWTGPSAFSATGSTISNLASGVYRVTILDQTLNCSDFYDITVGDLTPPITVTLNSSAPNTSCQAPFTGSLDVSASGTAGPYSFDWISGPGGFTATNTAVISSLDNGDYTVEVTDTGLGCTTTQLFTVANARPTLSITTSSIAPNSNCNAPFNGAITLNPVTGTPGGFDFSWSGPNSFTATTQDIAALATGDYTVNVTDQLVGCTGSLVVTVGNTFIPINTALVSNVSNTSCSAPFNGALNVTVTGGTSPYTFEWTGPSLFTASTEDISDLAPGNYSLRVIDATLCETTTNFTVSNAATGCAGLNCFAFTVSVVDAQTQRPSCSDQNDGVVTFNISGVTAGNYIVTLLKPSDPLFTAQTQIGPNGIYVFNNLSPGNYQYRLEDQVGNICVQDYSLQIETTVLATLDSQVNLDCFGGSTGTATITVTAGGNAPYQYSTDGINFIDEPSSTFTVSGLSAGLQSILVRDDASDLCPAEVQVTITAPTNINYTTSFTSPSSCTSSNGTLTITGVDAGLSARVEVGTVLIIDFTSLVVAPLTVSALPAGNYTVTIRNGLNCEVQETVTITTPNQVLFDAISTSASCSNGALDGKIDVLILNSPIGPFNIVVTNVATAEVVFSDPSNTGGSLISITDLSAADYSVSITPTNTAFCGLTKTVSVGGFAALSFADPVKDCTPTNQVVILNDIQGDVTVPLTINIVNAVTNVLDTRTTDPFPAITRTVRLDDLVLTEGSYRIFLTQTQTTPSGTCALQSAIKDYRVTPPITAEIYTDTDDAKRKILDSYPDLQQGRFTITNVEGGTPDYTASIELVDAFGQTLNFTSTDDILFEVDRFEKIYNFLPPGLFEVIVTDTEGCSFTFNPQVEVPVKTDVFIPNIFTPDNDPEQKNETFYIRNITPTGAKLVVSNRWGNEVFSSNNYQNNWKAEGVADGIYFYTLQTGGQKFTGWVEVLRGNKP
jgi:large repetitive protein